MTTTTKHFVVQGMHCKSCVKTIEEALQNKKGVKNASVDLQTETVTVSHDASVSLEDIKDTVRSVGYSVDGIKKKPKNLVHGIMYGIIPHTGCILFLIASVLGATVLMNLVRPLLMNRYIFHILIGISILFATLSSFIYLHRNGFLHLQGIKKKWKYLATMYGSTIGINLILFFVIFPLFANLSFASGDTQELIRQSDEAGSLASLSMDVDIPCPGHAPLITNELKTIDGVLGVEYSFPESFLVKYDGSLTSKEDMLDLEVFDSYPAVITNETVSASDVKQVQPAVQGGAGSCGSPTCGRSTCTGAGSCGSCGA